MEHVDTVLGLLDGCSDNALHEALELLQALFMGGYDITIIVDNMPATERMGRVVNYAATYSDDVVSALAVAMERGKRELPGYVLAGYVFEVLSPVPPATAHYNASLGRMGQYQITTWFDPPNAAVDTRNHRNLNDATQNILGQTLESDDPIFQGMREKKF